MYEYGGEPPQSFDKSCIPLQFTGIVEVVVDDVVDDEVLELELDGSAEDGAEVDDVGVELLLELPVVELGALLMPADD
jgi:hypothetical protein